MNNIVGGLGIFVNKNQSNKVEGRLDDHVDTRNCEAIHLQPNNYVEKERKRNPYVAVVSHEFKAENCFFN